jgi:hypothetical protein
MVTKISVAKEHIAEIEDFTTDERTQLEAAIVDLSTPNPRAELGAARFKRLMRRVAPSVGNGLWKIVLDVASEAAKKALTGG